MPPPSSSLSASRDLRLDTLRGLALVIMAINHLDGRLKQSTYQALGFVSAAEWFVYLSGLVAGLVYMRRWERHGAASVWARCARRAGQLYFYHVIIFMTVLLLGIFLPGLADAWRTEIPHYGRTLLLEGPLLAVFLGFLLIYQPTFLDILPMYALWVLLLPAVLWILRKRGGLGVMLGLSFALWFYAQTNPFPDLGLEIPRRFNVRPPYFSFLAWQFIFVLGLIVGSLRARNLYQDWLGRLLKVFILPAALLAVGLALLRWDILPAKHLLQLIDLRAGTQIPTLAWIRLLNFISQVLVVAWIGWKLPRLLIWRPLSFLGHHALQVFTAHLLVIFVGAAWIPAFSRSSWATELVCTSLMLASLFAAAWAHSAFLKALREKANPTEDLAPTIDTPS